MVKSLPGSGAPPLRLSQRRWTYDDLREMPESMERMEIIGSDLYMSPSPNVIRHQNAVGNLLYALQQWVRANRWGKVLTAPADVVLGADQVVQPDIFGVAQARLSIVGKFVDGPPDFIVEVVSPGSLVYDRETKYRLYERVGIREYWLVYPEDHSVEVFVLRAGRYELLGRYGRGEEAQSEVLSGFTVDVDAVFA
jgi:Uma2 family endonuclease